jgi:hypothetical protein
MTLSPTQNGELTVGLVREGQQHRYSVKCLVAREFVEGESDIFNTPVLLDGDKNNLYYENIVWRPRWFAWKYSRQFTNPEPWYKFGPILELDGDIYESYIVASIQNGILCEGIRESIYTYYRKPVFPTNQRFMYPETNI